MISLQLQCYNGHTFESSFRNEDAFEQLKVDEYLACPTCGVCDVDAHHATCSTRDEIITPPASQPSPQQVGITIDVV